MSLDRTTEAIAHFIGLFHIDTEAARMRDTYDAFRVNGDEAPEPGDFPDVTISIRTPYELNGFDPGVKLLLPSAPLEEIAAAFLPALDETERPAVTVSDAGEGPSETLVIRSGPTLLEPHWVVPLPNSIATVTVQYLHLTDNDLLTFGHEYPFLDPSVYTAVLSELAETAQALSLGVAEIMEPGRLPSVAELKDVFTAAMTLDVTTVEGAHVTIVKGKDASGIYVNGERVDEMPTFRDNLPASMREEDEEESSGDGTEDGTADETDDDRRDEEEVDNPYAVAPGHHVSTGENLSANEAYIGMSWVDADVIVVAGNVVNLSLISQTNVLVDLDSGAGHLGAMSHAVNAAQIELLSSDPDAAEAVDAAALSFPSNWEVTRVEGDVFSLNWVKQHIFATDHDRAEIEFSASATAIGMGGNTLANLVSLVELGFHYDLIIVGGNMITINMIDQINVLLDSDAISGAGAGGHGIDTSDNYLQNSATITTTGIDTMTAMSDLFRAEIEALAGGAVTISAEFAADAIFAGYETLSVLYISGDLIKLNSIQQYNYVGDADQVHLAFENLVATGGDAEVTITTGSNALLNDARIQDIGLDSTVMVGGDIYSDALIYQAELIDTNAVPNGVPLAGLTNEAVAAFLASDMIDPDPSAADHGGAGQPMPMDSGSLDVMQSVLT